MKKYRQKLRELISYGVFGVITTAINLLLFFGLESIGIYYIWANSIAYFLAVIINYIFNKKFVFIEGNAINNKKEQLVQLLKFIGMRLASLMVDNALCYVLVTILGFNMFFSRIGLSIAIILATFVINKIWIFKTK